MKWFGQECTKGMRVGTQSAEVTLFGQFEGDSGNERVLGMVGSCSSLCLIFGICLTSLLKGFLADMRVVVQNAMFLTL